MKGTISEIEKNMGIENKCLEEGCYPQTNYIIKIRINLLKTLPVDSTNWRNKSGTCIGFLEDLNIFFKNQHLSTETKKVS